MEYKKIISLLENTSNQPAKFRTKNWVEINDQTSDGRYNVNSEIGCKATLLKSKLCDYNEPCILVKGTITVSNTEAEGANGNNVDKKLIFQNWTPFTDCKTERNNTEIDNTKDIDKVMPMYKLI